jgi:hypothetical protein
MEDGRNMRHGFANAEHDAGADCNANAKRDADAVLNPGTIGNADTSTVRNSGGECLESGSRLQNRRYRDLQRQILYMPPVPHFPDRLGAVRDSGTVEAELAPAAAVVGYKPGGKAVYNSLSSET